MNDAWRAPAFMMSMQGYDVWLGNDRGNFFSCNHTTLDPVKDKKQFYNYDWEDMGGSDMPAVIDYVLGKTGVKKLTYIGHSQGTTQMFASLPDHMDFYRERLNLFIALAPPTRMVPIASQLLEKVAKHEKFLLNIVVGVFGIHNLFPRSIDWVTAPICNSVSWFCDLYIKMVLDQDPSLDNKERQVVSYNHFPSGASYRLLEHYG